VLNGPPRGARRTRSAHRPDKAGPARRGSTTPTGAEAPDLGFESLPAPDAWHLPCAYWFWHRIPTSAEIRTQLAEMRDAGIRSFQVQARLSLPMEDYLNADYLAAYRQAVDEAAAHGMVVGIYDDYNWQSGHAAGRAVDGHPELAETHLFWTSVDVSDSRGTAMLEVSGISSSSADLGEAGMRWHYDGAVPRWTDWTVVVGVVASGPAGPDASDASDASDGLGSVVDVTAACRVIGADDGCRIELDLPSGISGTATVFVSARCATSRLINHMDPAAVRRFVEAGYQPIADALGDHVGTTVQYVFFDQPHPNFFWWAQHRGQLGHAMPISAAFVDHLRERWGARLGEALLRLLHGTSSETRAVRCDFYEDYGAWARESFLGTVRSWTREHGLSLSGHEVLPHVGGWALNAAFQSWDLRVNFGLDFFAVDSYRDLTGCDAQDAVPQLAPKLADAVARANGRRGAMLEQYYADAVAGTGFYTGHWGLTPGEFRSQTVRHHLSGMRQQILHGFYLTDGHDGDPTMFANPRFDFPPGFNFEPWFARYHADIALETGRLSQFLDDLDQDRRVALLYPTRTIWADGQNGAHAPEFGRWAQTLTEANVAYDILDEAMLDDGSGSLSYDAVILAGVTTLASRRTLDTFGALLELGAELLVSGATPTAYQHGPQTAADDWAALVARHGHRITLSEGAPTATGAVERFHSPSLAGQQSSPAIAVVAGIANGRRRLAAFNDSRESAELELDVGRGSVAVVWHGTSGEVRSVVDGTSGLPSLSLAAGELVLVEEVAVQDGPAAGAAASDDAISGSGRLLIDGWTVRAHGAAGSGHDDDLVLHHVDPTRGLEQQGLPAFSGVVTYARTIALDSPASLVVELPEVVGGAEVFVNGRSVGRRGWTPYVFRVPLDHTASGDNTLHIEVAGTAANRYYAGTGMRDRPDPTGLLAAPRLHIMTG
jgi:hypothetical protein